MYVYTYTYTCMYIHKAVQLLQSRSIQIDSSSILGFKVALGIARLKIHSNHGIHSSSSLGFNVAPGFTVALDPQ